MWKALRVKQMADGSKRPKMIMVQAEGCQPIVRAFEEGVSRSEFCRMLHRGGRSAVPAAGRRAYPEHRPSERRHRDAVSDEEILAGGRELASLEGVFAAPEGAACIPAVRTLLANGFLSRTDRIVLYNTGSGLKYLDAYGQLASN
jgi:threonine synthase